MDADTRDYFYALLKDASPASKEYILQSIYGYLEGVAFSGDPRGLMFMCSAIQNHVNVDKGIN